MSIVYFEDIEVGQKWFKSILDKRESRSKPDRGIVRTAASLSNQKNIEVFSAVITAIVAKRPQQHSPLHNK